MKFLVIGNRGSMGQRRTKHLQELGHEVIGWDILDGTKMPIVDGCDGVIISTPPDHHEEYFCNISLPTFVEASVLPYKPRGNIFPSCTMRFHPTVDYLRKHLKDTNPLAFVYHVGNYVADWHPNEDYRKKYFARYETGGVREIVAYELHWLTDVFGPLGMAMALGDKLSKLQMEAEDHYAVNMDFKSKVRGTMVVELLSRPRIRDFRLIYEGKMEQYNMDNVDWEAVYRREIKAWVDTFDGGEWIYSVEEDLEILKQLFAEDENNGD